MKSTTFLLMSLILFCIATDMVVGQTFSIQGVLRDPLGRTVEDGSYSLTFRIYNVATGGAALWSETQGSVEVKHGVFTVELGTETSMAELTFDTQYYIGISVEEGQELEPRIKMTNSPSSYGVFGVKNTFPSVGNIGVGVTEPSAGLHIKTQNVADNLLKIESTAASGGTITVKADGKLGVNVVPEQALDIQGNLKMRSGSILFDDGSSLSSAYFGGSASSLTNNGNIIITTDADDNGSGEVQILSGAGTVVTVANNGYVGIGTATPATSLQVNGEIRTTKMTTTGNVGIGTTSPSYPLDVNGTARATTFSGSFSGNGASISSLNASNLSSGTVPNARLDSDLQDIANGSGCLFKSGIADLYSTSSFYADPYLEFRMQQNSYVMVYLKDAGNWTGRYLVSGSRITGSSLQNDHVDVLNPIKNEWRFLINHSTSSPSAMALSYNGLQVTFLILCQNSPWQYRLTLTMFDWDKSDLFGWQLIRFKN